MASFKVLFNISRNYASWSPVQRALLNRQNMVAQNIYVQYQDYLPKVVNNALSQKKFDFFPEIKERILKFSEYNIIGGKQLRGLLMLFSYENLKKPETLTVEQWEEAFKLAWSIEILQSILVVSDDVDDNAETRRGKICWHLLPDVGVLVINDVSMMRSFLYETVRQNFNSKPHYAQIINLFNQTFLNTSMGQHLDYEFNYLKNPDSFNDYNYRKMSIYKTSHYTFRFPILMALIHSQKATKESYDYVDKICDEIGVNLQMQNDFMDCFIDENTMGKTGTDIPTGKLSWMAVEALKHCNASQHKEFKACYGNPDPAYVERIQNLYLDLKLPEICRKIEKSRYDMIVKQINDLPPNAVPSREVFVKALDLVYNKTQIINYSE